MKKKHKLGKPITLILVIGFVAAFTLVSCDDGNSGDDPCKAGHVWGEWDISGEGGKKATCSEKGRGTRKCDACGIEDTNTEIPIDKDNHNSDKWNWVETKAAAIDQNGVETQFCDLCDATTGETRTITLYVITGSGTSFSAAYANSDPVDNATGAITNVIDAIKEDADGKPVAIQFGDGIESITTTVTFNGDGIGWGTITVLGRVNTAGSGNTITLNNGASMNSLADISNTNNVSGNAVYHNSTGTLNIRGGTISATGGNSGVAVGNYSTGTVNISGGRVEVTMGAGSVAVHNDTNGTIIISGGRIQAAGGRAIHNKSSGKIIVSGAVWDEGTQTGTLITSANIWDSRGTIQNFETGEIQITGGTIRNTVTGDEDATAINNLSSGTVTISGGLVTAAGLGTAIRNVDSDGTVSITGGRVEALEPETGFAIRNTLGTVTVSGTAEIVGQREGTIGGL
jgi:hypothetical protein